MATKNARSTSGRGELYDSVVDTIGNTPCIKVNSLAPSHVNLYVKAEFFNPAGSVKDRLAISIIEEAEKRGELKPGQTVIEATSGNTGIGLAMVCAAKGYPLVITMADSFSIERRKLMRFLGARVILTPRAEKGFGMYKKAKELADKNGWFLASQFETPDAYAKYLRTIATDDKKLYKMFSAQVFSLGLINQRKNNSLRKSMVFFVTALTSELMIIMYLAYLRAYSYLDDRIYQFIYGIIIISVIAITVSSCLLYTSDAADE